MIVNWSDYAQFEFLKTLDYVEEHFGEQTRNKLFNSVNDTNDTLMRNPFAGRKEPLLENNLIQYRSILVSDINRIIYFVDKGNVNVVDFWDMRRDPDFLAKRISNY
ncbi:MAG: type II toxin-antitoxin system RelE/ParE family toxin [Bacteroidales bacterium]|nr:type II toxin-antitoxin system RelE/ParE family toxin [Bacteroidales bacterium]